MRESFGVRVPLRHILRKLAGIATSGRMTSNAERDLHVILEKRSQLKVQLEWVPCRMYDPKNACIVQTSVPVLMPDRLAAAIWALGQDVFEYFFCGGMSRNEIKSYWDHVYDTSEWYRNHPCSTQNRSCQIPLSFYGDGVTTYKNTEIGNIMVLAWTSDFSYGMDPELQYMLLGTYSEHCASGYTYNDIMRVVCGRVARMQDPSVRHPWSDAYSFVYSSCQGDLKFLRDMHNIHPYTSNRFCSWCQCEKAHQDVGMTLGDMREGAAHWATTVSNEEYLQCTPENQSAMSQKSRFSFWVS